MHHLLHYFIGLSSLTSAFKTDTSKMSYGHYLRNYYQSQEYSSPCQWPPVPTKRIFKLAMIQKENVQRGRIDDELVTLVTTGRVNAILQKKTPVCLENLFAKCERKKLVLIEGAPGSGKSTLALHICQEWADGKLFQEFNIAVLVRLRDPFIKRAKSIKDILPSTSLVVAREVSYNLSANDGRGVLWILDGWDELPSDLPEDSIIKELVPFNLHNKTLFSQSAVIITSRPSSSAELHPLVSSRVEVLGFTRYELEQYFTDCLQGDEQSVQMLLRKIQENPAVESSCYLPLNASIVAHIFLSGDHSILSSTHAIFTSVIRFHLSRYMQNRLGVSQKKAKVKSLDSIPKRLRNIFSQLCKVAFYGIVENKITFSASDLKFCGTLDKIADMGLLQAVPSILVNDREYYYNFLHLTIQEMLAALHISHLSSTDQMAIFKEMFGHPRFISVFKFYAKLTKLKAHRPLLSLMPKFIFPDSPRGVLDLISNILKKGEALQILSVLHCLCEAEDTSLSVFVANRLDLKLDLSHTLLSPLDCLAVGHFLSSVCSSNIISNFTVNLTDCTLSDLGCKFLIEGIKTCSRFLSRIPCKLNLLLFANGIDFEGVRFLTEILVSTSATFIRKLDLSENELGNEGVTLVCEALTENTTVELLFLRKCSLTINDTSGSAICQLLSRNVCLKFLSLSWNPITNCRHIATGLSGNKALKTLHLCSCDLTDQSVQELSSGLNNYIEELYLHGCNSITEDGMYILASKVANLVSLKHLWIPSTSSTISPMFADLNKDRLRCGLSEIRVTCTYERVLICK